MSFTLSRRAWTLPVCGNVKYVLLAICDAAKDSGVCFPGVDAIALKCGINEKTVRRAVIELTKLGFLKKWRRFGTSNIYQVVLPKKEEGK